MSLSSFLEGCLTLDLEISADGRVRDIGAIRAGEKLLIRNAARSNDALQQLDKFSRGARFIVGHNLVAHDRPFIEAHLPGAEILDLPIVDTLYLGACAVGRFSSGRMIRGRGNFVLTTAVPDIGTGNRHPALQGGVNRSPAGSMTVPDRRHRTAIPVIRPPEALASA